MGFQKLYEDDPGKLEMMTEMFGSDAEMSAVLIFFDRICPNMKKMNHEELGELFEAIVTYARTGKEPPISSERADMAFAFIRPSIDVKRTEYRVNHARSVIHGKYMAYCRNRKEGPFLSEEEFADGLLFPEAVH